MIRARAIGVQVEVVHNASAMGAAASCGLQVNITSPIAIINIIVILLLMTSNISHCYCEHSYISLDTPCPFLFLRVSGGRIRSTAGLDTTD
jgi:hypothetical protein